MCRVLILDDDKRYAESLKPIVEDFEGEGKTLTDTASTLDEALGHARRAVSAGQPYTVFIIDQKLGAGKDGIAAMKDLKDASPDSDAIILTALNDQEVGVRAYQSGAFRYLSKPVEPEELEFVLQSLMQARRGDVENKWRKVFSEMMETALHKTSFTDVAKVVVNNSLQLGFSRAHVFWFSKTSNALLGIECAGGNSTREFSGRQISLYDEKGLGQYLQKRDASFIESNVVGKKLKSGLAALGITFPPSGLWVLPLWSGAEMLGALMLDFWDEQKTFGSHERSLLDFFARQVSITLEHADLYDAEKRASQEALMMSRIGREVGTNAATQNLKNLLEQIRLEVGKQFDNSNISIFLHNEQDNTLDFELQYVRGVSKNGKPRIFDNGLEEYMLSQKKEIAINDVRDFAKDHGIKLTGISPYAWLGAPLQVGTKIIGGVCIQSFKKGVEFTERDKRILRAVADQVAGAVQISNYKKEEDEDRRRMLLLQQTNLEMLRIAQHSQNDFWLTVLTVATSNFGLGFNRAILFLAGNNFEILHGMAAVGSNKREEARRHWKRDEKRKYDFNSFLTDLSKHKVHLTAFHEMVMGVEISLNELGKDTRTSLEANSTVRLSANDLSSHLPESIIRTFDLGDCALLPLGTKNIVSGLLIVDNHHNREPLKEKSLSSLQNLLANAWLVRETLRQREKSDDLLDANLEILGTATHQSLQKTLDRICRTAHIISRADWTIVHPFRKDKKPFEIEVENVGHYGELLTSIEELTKSNMHIGGVSRHVLKRGRLIVSDIDKLNRNISRLKLSEHHFIKSEGVKALIGVAVKDPSIQEPLGILYLDYRQPREFSDSDIHHAESLASLAAVAISNAHEMDEIKQRRQFELAKEIAEAVGASLDLEETMTAILSKLHETFKRTRLCVLLYEKRRRALKFAPGTINFYKVDNPKYNGQDTFPIDHETIACRVARQSILKQEVVIENVKDVNTDPDYLVLNKRVRSEFCISLLNSKSELLGVMALEREQVDGFGKEDIEVIKTVAQHISIAIERAWQSEDLEYNSTVAAQTSWAANIAHEVNNEVGKILNWAYFIRMLAGDNLEIQEYAKNIENSTSQLSNTNPWSTGAPQAVELDQLLKSHVLHIAELRNIEVEWDLGAPDIIVNINVSKFQFVLRHLLNNAASAMSNMEKKKIRVSTRAMKDENMVEIYFQDFGPGISEDRHTSAFHRRFTTKDRGGYGLLFVRQMVESMKGEIMLLPFQEGTGAEFLIQLPIDLPT